MIHEREILFRIQNFQERRPRITTKIHSKLVDFIQHENRIVGARLVQSLNDTTGQRADVRSPMTAYFRLVAHPAKRDAHEFST